MRYKKIDPATYGDERYRALSPAAPSAQFLWFYLLTGPHTCPLPGLFGAGEAGLAEALGWPLPAFRRVYREIEAQGMAKADWRARVVWIPKAIKHNEPENPSVVRSWLKWLDEIPQCDLKRQAIEEIGRYLAAMGPGWAVAWSTRATTRATTRVAGTADTCPDTSATSVAVAVAGAGAGAGAGERDSLPQPPLSPAAGSGKNGRPSRRHVDAAWGRGAPS